MELANKVAVITGGASGIGRGTALALARRGADLVLADIHEERLAETRAAVEALGRRALALRCDVTSDADVERLAEVAIAEMEHVDVLMNNAGVVLCGALESMPVADWQWEFDINVFGVVRGLRAFLPHMLARGSGYVVNTASMAGLFGSRPGRALRGVEVCGGRAVGVAGALRAAAGGSACRCSAPARWTRASGGDGRRFGAATRRARAHSLPGLARSEVGTGVGTVYDLVFSAHRPTISSRFRMASGGKWARLDSKHPANRSIRRRKRKGQAIRRYAVGEVA